MAEPASSFLAPWSNFYIMIGSSAAALTGLMFVVITLVTGSERSRKTEDGISAFSTPTVAHFGAALLASAILSAPWHALIQPATLLGLTGLCGVTYIVRVTHKQRRLSGYRPDLEDWVWYTVFPLVAYGAIFAGAVALSVGPANALFALAGGATLLVFLGIRNAWDIVTFIALKDPNAPPSSS